MPSNPSTTLPAPLPTKKQDMAKIIKDCIYGHIQIPGLCEAFINVPEFQRLRRVKQLGLAHYAFPSAVHTRFEHSIGVMHLAGKVIDVIARAHPVDEHLKSCVQLAGLYHDIGHFAFSHLFDTFLKSCPRESSRCSHESPSSSSEETVATEPDIFSLQEHEDRSVYFLRKVNDRLKLLTEEDVRFISGCIHGTHLEGYPPYLFEIVSDKVCGLDVDRQDYINRDANRCGFPSFQSDYIIHNTLITSDLHLAYRAKCRRDIRDFFSARKRMYENVYFHHTVKKVDKMVLCMMRRLGEQVFQFGEMTDDYNMETLFRSSPITKGMMELIDNRKLEHSCEVCANHPDHHPITSDQFAKVIFL